MGKAMTLASMVIAGLFVLVFGLDLALGVPFQRASGLLDILFLVAALMLGYTSWNAFRDIH